MGKKQSFDLNEVNHKNDFREQKYKYRWVRYLIFPLLIGFVLLLILSNINTNDCFQSSPGITATNESNNGTDVFAYQRDVVIYDDAITCDIDNCNISCINGEIIDFGITLENLNDECTTLVVDIENCNFPNSKMKLDWLAGISKANVITLRIVNCQLNEIEDEAFKLAKNLQILHLKSVQLKRLQLYSFKFLMNLKELIIENSNENFQGDSFLSYFAATVQYISFNSLVKPLNTVNPIDWLRSGSFHSLTILNFTSNNFGDKLIRAPFSNCVIVEKLILNSCWISSLVDDVFDTNLRTLNYIDLRNNQLKTLSENLVTKFVSPMKVLIEGNLWDCACDLKGFVHCYNSKIDVFDENVRCKSPKKYEDKLISDETVCGEDLPSTPIPPPSLPTSTTAATDPEEDEPKLITIACKSAISPTVSIIQVNESDVNFTISMVSYTSARIDIDSNYQFVTVLWFYQIIDLQNGNYFVNECQENVENELIVIDLKQNQTYTFCILTQLNSLISPFNCQGYYTNIEMTATLPDDHVDTCDVQKLTIILLSISIFLALIAGGLSVFLLIRWRPTLLKGNKRLIFLNKSQTNVLVMPQNRCTKTPKCTTSTSAVSRSKSCPNTEKRRRMSDISVCSGKSYILPNMYEAIQYKRQMEYEIATDRVYFEELPTNSPPPLPKRSSQTDQFDENNYIHFPGDYSRI